MQSTTTLFYNFIKSILNIINLDYVLIKFFYILNYTCNIYFFYYHIYINILH